MSKNRVQYIFVLIFVGTFFLFYSCGTTRNTGLSRRFQNMTSHYNVYYNGKTAYDTGLDKVKHDFVLDYSIPLPVFIEDIPEARGVGSSYFKKAITKSDKLVKKHSIKVKPKKGSGDAAFMKRGEWNDWVDNAYVLKGKALYCSGKVEDAQFVFQMIIQKYPYSESLNEAKLWISRSFFTQGEDEEAIVYLQKLEATKGLSKSVRRDISLVWADYQIKSENYGAAITRLENALKFPMSGADKRRYNFLLGQLYASMDKKGEAVKCYQKVLGMNTPYRMSFYAKIGIYELDNSKRELKKSKRFLGRLLRDEKNEDFQDRIYYALGNIYWEQSEQDVAIDYYKQSVTLSEANPTQRVESSLRLADIFFDRKKYRNSQAYYDTAVSVIPSSYPKANEIRRRAKFLTALTENLQVIETQDSLQNLAGLPKDVLDKKIVGWIKDERKRQREEMLRKQSQQQNDLDDNFFRSNAQMNLSQQNPQRSGSSGSSWYFYNPSTVASGKASFRQIWGKRALSDNWRRADKSKMEEGFGDEVDTSQDGALEGEEEQKQKKLSPLDKGYYVKDIPRNDSMFVASDKKICLAAYNAARIYGEDLDDVSASLEMFDLYLRKVSDPQMKLTALYYAYDLSNRAGRKSEAEMYKARILNGFGHTRIAMYLRNPESFESILKARREQDDLYAKSVVALRLGQYDKATSFSSEIVTNPQDSTLLPKAAYIQMVSVGAQKGSIYLEGMIKEYKLKYPKSELMPRVLRLEKLVAEQSLKDYATMVQNGYIHSEIQNQEAFGSNGGEFVDQKFENIDETFFYYVIEVGASLTADLNRLRFDVAHFNIDFFPEDDFDVDIEKLNEATSLIVVRTLPNKDFAKIYFNAITHQKRAFSSLNGTKFKNYVISSKNFRTIKEDKVSMDYQKFFIRNFSQSVNGLALDQKSNIDPMVLLKELESQKQNPEPQGQFVAVNTAEVAVETVGSEEVVKSEEREVESAVEQTKSVSTEQVNEETSVSELLENKLAEKPAPVVTNEPAKAAAAVTTTAVVASTVESTSEEVEQEVLDVRKPEDVFTGREDIRFAVIFIVKKDVRTMNKVRQQLMLVNIKDLNKRNYKVSAENYDASTSFVVVRGLSDYNKALAYVKALVATKRYKEAVVGLVNEAMVISEENLRRLNKNKEMDLYRTFYRNEKMPMLK
ncbi:tetratricopeptide repeat protein [Halosquirtibacter xylanolyticus]|uniref:type IX secretion system periplasmic lipoprotein PorW/SprE n=1 Tax=Halosquirtibacter xylanolyticus TaxID=3374599 RepID=UPI00374897AE|nr:tetratricopeptide repeat protein [Prolixibacteraceae bacterium]